MRDYAELVSDLHICGGCNDGEVCQNCSRFSRIHDYENGDAVDPCNDELLLDAADAIEELLAERDRYKSFFDRIKDLPDCNICLKKNRCEFEPRPGEYTRINCAFCLTAQPKEDAECLN